MISDALMLEMGKWMWEGGPSPSQHIIKDDFVEQLWTDYKDLRQLADEHDADYTVLDNKYRAEIERLTNDLQIATTVAEARLKSIERLNHSIQHLESSLAWANEELGHNP